MAPPGRGKHSHGRQLTRDTPVSSATFWICDDRGWSVMGDRWSLVGGEGRDWGGGVGGCVFVTEACILKAMFSFAYDFFRTKE